jgi:hypothetical protein
MAGIKATITDLLARLETITDFKLVRVWNNQLKMLDKLEAIPFPAAFLEIVAPEQLLSIGAGVTAGDLKIRIHVCHDHYDSQDGTMGQDLDIFDLKDKVVKSLSSYAPTACSALQRTGESQNYDHDNLYEYLVEFATHMIDSKGSKYDPATTTYIDSAPLTDIEIDATVQDSIDGVNNIPKTDYKI